MKNREISALLDQAHGYASEYLNDVDIREVYPTDESIAGLGIFDEPLPVAGADPGCVKSRTWCDRTLKSPLSHDTTPFNERSRGRIPSSG